MKIDNCKKIRGLLWPMSVIIIISLIWDWMHASNQYVAFIIISVIIPISFLLGLRQIIDDYVKGKSKS